MSGNLLRSPFPSTPRKAVQWATRNNKLGGERRSDSAPGDKRQEGHPDTRQRMGGPLKSPETDGRREQTATFQRRRWRR